jgi:hypothetical protein
MWYIDRLTHPLARPTPMAPPIHTMPTWCSYQAAHTRIRALWGRASQYPCTHCGVTSTHAQWAYDGSDPDELTSTQWGQPMSYSMWPEYYLPLCRPCHKAQDLPRTPRTRWNNGNSVRRRAEPTPTTEVEWDTYLSSKMRRNHSQQSVKHLSKPR